MSSMMLPPVLPDTGLIASVALETSPAVDLQNYLPAQPVQQTQAVVLAQFEDVDVLGDIANAWSTFISSGQVWALLVGLVFGYLIRGLTSY